MKIGILFHSHLRSFRNTHESFKLNVLKELEKQGHEYDIFIHTWDKEEFSTKTWHEGAKEIKKTDFFEVLGTYKPRDLEVEVQNLKNNNREIFGRPYEALKAVWYSFYRSFKLMKKYEEKSGKKYDALIVTRPDVQHFSKIFIDEIETTNCVWQCQVFPKKAATDVLLYGGRDDIEKSLVGFYLNFDKLHSDQHIKKYNKNEYVFNDYLETKSTVKKSQYCMPRDWRILRSWWDKNKYIGNKKWDRELAIKDINAIEKYKFFRRKDV